MLPAPPLSACQRRRRRSRCVARIRERLRLQSTGLSSSIHGYQTHMRAFSTRAGRWSLALTLAAVATLAARPDEPPAPPRITAPGVPSLTIGDVVTVSNTSGGAELGSLRWALLRATAQETDRKSTRLNSSHGYISYAVFC